MSNSNKNQTANKAQLEGASVNANPLPEETDNLQLQNQNISSNNLLKELDIDNLTNAEKNNLQKALNKTSNKPQNNNQNNNKLLNNNNNNNNNNNKLLNNNNNKNNNKNYNKNKNDNVKEELEETLEKNNKNINKINNDKAKEVVSGMFTSAANTVSEYSDNVSGNENVMLVLKLILAVILFIVFINIIKYFYNKWESNKNGSPMLVNGTKNAKQAMVISQDPQHTNYVPIKRSVNQNGIEFSYALWFLISDFSYKQGEWKHIFHKGNSSSYPNRAPGIWIHPNANIIRVYMNTMKDILEYVDIDNIPVRKWVHIVVVMKNRHLQVYINGLLKVRKELPSLPRQNYGNVWINMYGGYEGYLSKLQYFDRAISGKDIDDLVTQGPGSGNCIDTKEVPPYLDDSWWTN